VSLGIRNWSGLTLTFTVVFDAGVGVGLLEAVVVEPPKSPRPNAM
jgi:hypothetical protein